MNDRRSMPSPAREAEGTVQPRGKEALGAVTEKDNQHNRDLSSKAIFDNAVPCDHSHCIL